MSKSGGRVRARPPIAAPLFLIAIVLVATNLRGPLVALSPVESQVRAGFGIGAAQLGLLTSLPVLCFGLSAPLALMVIRRLGADRAVTACLAAIVVATLLRSVGTYPVALASTLLLGVAITVGNVVVPVLIRSDVPPSRRGMATGVYTAGINVGTMLTSVCTVPIALVLGWRAAIASWSVLGVVAATVWLVMLWGGRRRSARIDSGGDADTKELAESERLADADADADAGPIVDGGADPAPTPRARTRDLHDALPWLLAAVFTAQAFSYYGITTWLPTLLADERGLSASIAGDASAIFQIAGLVGGLGVPLLARRLRPDQTLLLVGACWCILPVGLLLAPRAFGVWAFVGGAAQGAGFSAIFTIIVRVARDSRHSAFLSAFVQGVGYSVAAVAPSLLGGLHETTDGWTAPLCTVVISTVLFTVLGVVAARRAQPVRPAS